MISLEELDLDVNLAKSLKNQKIFTLSELMLFKPYELVEKLNTSYTAIDHLFQEAVELGGAPDISFSELECPKSNSILSILSPGHLTEFFGPPSSGKSYFCLNLAVCSLMENRDAKVVYVDTDMSFNFSAFCMIAHNKLQLSSLEPLMKRLVLIRCGNFSSFASTIDSLQDIVFSANASLLIIDSITTPFKVFFPCSSADVRFEWRASLAKHSQFLKHIAFAANIPVVCTNQVTTSYKTEEEEDNTSCITASLGKSWPNYVGSRLLLEYQEGVRSVQVVKSSLLPNVKTEFSISNSVILLEDFLSKLFGQV